MTTHPYLRDNNERIVLAAFTNGDGITFEPFIEGDVLGYRVTEVKTGRVEYILLAPSYWREFNPENGSTADTFVYRVEPQQAAIFDAEQDEDETLSVLDYAEPITYVNHFEKSREDH